MAEYKKSHIFEISLSCAVCGNTDDLKRCSRCQKVLYCSREHQIAHWKTHKGECANVTTITKTVKSETSHDLEQSQLNLIKWQQTYCTDAESLCEHVSVKLKSQGYCIVDGFHDSTLCTSLKDEVIQLKQSGKFQEGLLAGGRTSGKQSEMVIEKKIRSDKILWLEGNEAEYPAIAELVATSDAIVAGLNMYFDEYSFQGRTKAMVACYPGNGTYYSEHVDNPNKDGRCVTCIFYLNQDWDPKTDGGILRILRDGEKYIDIAPYMNRLLFFWSDRRTPHEVKPAYKQRYAITTWYFDKSERQAAKEDQINEEIAAIRGEIALIDIKTKTAAKAAVKQKIEKESRKAISLLSKEELEAIAVIVKDHPNPQKFLSSLGIAEGIQDALLEECRTMNSIV